MLFDTAGIITSHVARFGVQYTHRWLPRVLLLCLFRFPRHWLVFLACFAAFAHKLQVVFSLVESAGDPYALPGDLLDANEWVRVFLQTGGMQHLLALLGRDGSIDPSQVGSILLYQKSHG